MNRWVPEVLTPRERVRRAMAGEAVDRPAAINPTSIINVEMMDLTDSPFPDAHRDAEKMTNLAETGYTQLGMDTIMPVFSIIQESVALGCDIDWMEKDNWATCRGHLATRPEEIRLNADWLQRPTARVVLDALTELRRRYEDVYLIGKAMGPWTLAYHIYGVENFLLMSIDDRDAVVKTLDLLKEYTVEYSQAQLDAGADAVTIPDHATGDLVNAEYYREFLKDIHTELVERIPGTLIMHICGRTVDRMPDIGKTGFHAFHFDSKNLPDESMEAIGGRTKLVGNVNNPIALFKGTPEMCYAEAVRAMNAGVRLVGAECAVPLRAPTENLQAIGRAVRDYPNMAAEERQAWEQRANIYNGAGQLVSKVSAAR